MRMSRRAAAATLWTIRVLGILAIAMVTLMVFSPNHNRENKPLQADEIAGIVFFPSGVMLGTAIGFKWQKAGGFIATASLLLFYTTHLVMHDDFPGGPWFLVFSLPGLMFHLMSLVKISPEPG